MKNPGSTLSIHEPRTMQDLPPWLRCFGVKHPEKFRRWIRSFFIVAACLFFLFVSSTGNAWFLGKCVAVTDGDTIKVLRGGKAVRIRLFGVDCPERGQDFYRRAKEFTSEMVFGRVVEVTPVDQDDYGRLVAWVSVDGRTLNKELVAEGLAWWYRRHAPKEKELGKLEKQARKAKKGIWSLPDPTPPWEFRRQGHSNHRTP